MRPITPEQREAYRREQAEREYERSLNRLADLDVAGSRRAAKMRRTSLIWRIALIGTATLATLALMRATEAMAQVPTDRLDQTARCGVYLFIADPEADGDLIAEAVLQGLSTRQGAAVALRIKEMTNNLTSLEDADQLRAYKEIERTWRPNCVAIGLLGGGK
jgi:hypothetical protein